MDSSGVYIPMTAAGMTAVTTANSNASPSVRRTIIHGLFQCLRRLLRLILPHPPVSGHQHRSPHAQPHAENMIDGDKLVGQGGRRQGLLRQSAHHNGIQHVDAYGNQTLQRDGQRQRQHPEIKFSVFRKEFFIILITFPSFLRYAALSRSQPSSSILPMPWVSSWIKSDSSLTFAAGPSPVKTISARCSGV